LVTLLGRGAQDLLSGRCGVSPLGWGVGRRGRLRFAGVDWSRVKGVALPRL